MAEVLDDEVEAMETELLQRAEYGDELAQLFLSKADQWPIN